MGWWRRRDSAPRSSDRADLEREIRAHLDDEMDEQIEDGASRDAARRAALRAFGNTARVHEDVRELSRWIWMERLVQDVRYGLRMFWRTPSFTTIAILTLALGIGANVAMFAVVDGLLLQRLPVREPAQLAVVRSPDAGDFDLPDFRLLSGGTRLCTAVIGSSSLLRVNAGLTQDTAQAFAKIVSPNYFEGLGVQPFAGRTLASIDPRDPLVVVSHRYWSASLGGSRDVVGRTLMVDGTPFTIAGIAPAGFAGDAPGESPDIFASFALEEASRFDAPGYSWLNVIARLKPGVSRQQVSAEFAALLTAAHPTDSKGQPIASRVETLDGSRGWSRAREQFGQPLVVLTALVGLLFVITCTNVASLLLARGAARSWELTLRMAIGGSRSRIVRQLLTESLLLAIPGGVLGIVMAMWIDQVLVDLVSNAANGFSLAAGPSVRTIAFAAGTSVLAALLFGTAPALRAIRPSARGLNAGDRRLVGRERRWGLRESLIVVQVALTFVLVTGGVLFVRTLKNLESQELGYQQTSNLLVGALRPDRGYKPKSMSFISELLDRVRAIPGVSAASFGLNGPVAFSGSGVGGLRVDGFTPASPQDLRSRADWVTPQYFRAAGLPILAGREFADGDVPGSPRVAVVNRTWARFYFGTTPAVGRHFTFNKIDYEIVGIAADAKYTDLREPAPRVIYFDLMQGGGAPAALQIRTSSFDPTSLVRAIRSAVQEVDPRLHVELVPFAEQFGRKLSRESLLASLSGFFGVMTLLLVAIAIYGALAFAVARRTREIAVRLALGSRRMRVVWTVVRDVMIVLIVGAAIGIAIAAAVGRLVASLLFGAQPTDVVTVAMTAGALAGAALLATALPALRASRLDPAAVLRE